MRGMQYVEDCFSNASLFHKALKEAFESFCNKQIAGATMAQLMADYCNTLLKKVRDVCYPCLAHVLIASHVTTTLEYLGSFPFQLSCAFILYCCEWEFRGV